jgi:hypothetical protein
MGESMSNINAKTSMLSLFVSSNSGNSPFQGRILLDMFKFGKGKFLGIPSHVGSSQINDLKMSGLIDIDRNNNIYPTKNGRRVLENLILGEDDCTYPLKEARAADKFKKGIPLHLLAKSSSVSRM